MSRSAVLGFVLVTGCASAPRVPSSRSESPGAAYARIRDSIDLARSLKPDEVAAAPRIRLVVPSATFATSHYVNAAFHLSADAYVLVVVVDLDRRVRVLYPESPEESGFAAQQTVHRLTSVFPGFGLARQASRFEGISASQRISPIVGEGLLLAVASDRPLQLQRVLDEVGEWDEQSLQRLVYDRSLAGAAHALGGALVLTGQDYNVDYSTFGGSRVLNGYGAFASSGFHGCGYGYGFDGFGTYASASSTRLVGVFVRDGVRVARYVSGGSCGNASYYDVTVGPTRLTPRDTTRRDTTVTQMRPPQTGGVPRNPTAPPMLIRQMAPSDVQGGTPDRPLVESGLRFRRPEQMPAPGVRPLDLDPSWREREDVSTRQRPHAQDQETRPLSPRSGEQEPERSAPVRREPVRSEPVRSEPVRSEPVRSEPVRSEPVRSEPARSEPVQRAPTPVTPPPAS